ncbi:MAG: hypothetical protein AUK44_10355 [Porphyromonadaceae bacterium CG2_30_38_12]|nr:MAG: hypothetical protein AUK44_10355 [Porphyromonadaceae bacterium CG2_30_38_12]
MKPAAIIIAIFLIFPLGVYAQIQGCTDPLSTNYNPQATANDGSCAYADATITPTKSWNLPEVMQETSGLISFDGKLWTHNDNDDTNLYGLNTNFDNYTTFHLSKVKNTEWEEISQDDFYIYLGDFGNNSLGNRTDLNILRVEKLSLLAGSPAIDTISFSYENQTDFNPTAANKTDFDCEAFIVTSDSIYLFTKQWLTQQTAVYALSKIPGTHKAKYKFSLPVEGLITGATTLNNKKITVLTGYSTMLQPFLYLLYDYQEMNFDKGNKRKINLNLPYHQVEGICTENGVSYYISNEKVSNSFLSISPKAHELNLEPYLKTYFGEQTSIKTDFENSSTVFFNPYTKKIVVRNQPTDNENLELKIYTVWGQIIKSQLLKSDCEIPLSIYPKGIYCISMQKGNQYYCQKIRN